MLFECINNLTCYINLLEELNNIIDWNEYNQICLNAPVGHEDDHQIGGGSLIKDWDNSYKEWDDATQTERWVVPDRKVPLHEHDFTETVTLFRNTVFETILGELKQNYRVGRVRIMKLEPKTCLTWHKDDTCRIHYPILTNPGSKMIIDNEVQQFGLHEWWWANTIHSHTAINAHTQPRLHIVACLL